jgi:signal peptidase I
MQTLPVKISGDSMWPNFIDGQIVNFHKYNGESIDVGDVIVFPNPFNTQILLVKRVVNINENMCVVEGDNPDPTASTDSHNFGPIDISSIVAFRHNHIAE